MILEFEDELNLIDEQARALMQVCLIKRATLLL